MIVFKESPLVLTDGGFEPFTLLDDAQGRESLRTMYETYAHIAAKFDLPMQLGTPTWRASRKWTSDVAEINAQAVSVVREAASSTGARIVIAGLIGPSNEGYDPSNAPTTADALAYHREQATALASAGVDFLYAASFPAIDELHGAARAMSETALPFVLAPMLHPDGTMMDGTTLAAAIERLDRDPAARPWHYLLGCLYPTQAATALESLFRTAPALAHRVVGLKANASPTLEVSSPEEFARDLWDCASTFGLHVLGGGCGTDARHIEALAVISR